MKKALVVYDSVHGNTERIAQAVVAALPAAAGARAARPEAVIPADLESLDLLIVGSPTLGGRATPAIQRFLDHIPPDALKDVGVAAFDTRMGMRFAKIFGYAARRIADCLAERGGRSAASPEGFIVMGREGPLKEGEIDRASAWAKGMGEAAR